MTVARQLASIAELAPGRLTFGVGIGGEDRHEIEVCGVDPRTRGRRMDECLQILRALACGEPVTFDGELFSLRDALILPAPSPAIPLVVGGRSEAAVRRAGRLGDGWLGIWVSPKRYATVVDQIREEAAGAGRDPSGFEHAMNVWCGFGATREAARERLAAAMQTVYQMPFEPFERYSPYGTPEEVADFLHPYVEAGCTRFNVIPCASDHEAAVAAVGELRRLLTDEPKPSHAHDCPSGDHARGPEAAGAGGSPDASLANLGAANHDDESLTYPAGPRGSFAGKASASSLPKRSAPLSARITRVARVSR